MPEDSVIMAFGDSLTAGYGVNKTQSYPNVLANLTGLKVVNAGVIGETTQQGLNRIDKLLETHQPGLVILLEGGNDVLQKVPTATIKDNLRQMILKIQAHGVAVVLIGVPPKKLFADSMDLYSELSDEFNIPLEDDIVASLIMKPSMKSDYVHFNAKGYQALAEAIYKKVQDSGAVK
ncbi:arylesterase [Thiomicrorhabdus hydrogeniphila]